MDAPISLPAAPATNMGVAPPAPAPAPVSGGMDQQAVNLAKAIRQTESGGDFNAKGASGESGAYQWTAPTWQEHAQQILGDPNAPMTPQNQNAVAYGMIKTWKDNGLNAAQIAAKWNSGSETGWENKVGVNSSGVKYNVPAYVKSVTDAYQKIKGGGEVGIDPNNPSSIQGTQYGTIPPAQNTQQNADQQNAQETGATFPADTSKDNWLAAAGKTLGNIPSSIFGFAKGALNSLNPVNIAKNIGQIGQGLGEISKMPGGIPSYLAQAPLTLPKSAYDVVVPEAGKGVVQGIKGLVTGNMNEAGQGFESAQRNIVNNPFGSVAPFVMAAEGGANAIDKVAGTDLASSLDNAISKTASPVTGAGNAIFGKIADMTKGNPADTFESAVGKAFQPKNPYEAETAGKVAANVDFSSLPKNATYGQLSDFLQKEIDTRQTKVNDIMGNYEETFKPADLKKTVTGEGGNTATVNYTKEAIDGLKELYKTTKDPQSLVEMKDLETKFKNQGLTSQELNDLAKQYGSEFGKKAFDKMGNPLTSTGAQTYETIRSGVKENARGTLPNDEARALDKNTSSLIRVKEMTDRMSQKVDQLSNRIVERNLGQQIGRAIGTVADFTSGGILRGFIARLFPSNIGLKTMNSLDLESQLGKNLNTIQSLSNAPDNIIINTIKNMAKKVNNLPSSIGAAGASNQRVTSNFGR